MQRFVSYVIVAALLAGCGPSLDQVARTTQTFAVQQRCAQGPFEVHVPAFGSIWGEDITVEAHGNSVEGHATVSVDGEKRSERQFASFSSVNTNACMLSAADRTTGSAPIATSTSNGTAGTSPMMTSSTNASVTPSAPSVTVGLIETHAYVSGARTEIARYHYEVTDWNMKSGLFKRGQDVKILFWSERPLDLANTFFVVTHSEMVAPNGDDKKWSAHLDEVKASAEAEQRQSQKEADAHAEEVNRCSAIQGADKKCHDENLKTASEVFAYAELQRRCEALARDNATDQACRDDGWRNENERPNYHPNAQVATTSTESRHGADRPPPPPIAETQTPRPSDHAEWVSGSWEWNGSDWAWLGGGWRVPDQDRAQRLTATAPSAPPASRMETRPPQPIASAVWADGYWHWSNAQWVWVPGHWAVPPSAGATWRASTWVRDGVQLRLDPGRWIAH